MLGTSQHGTQLILLSELGYLVIIPLTCQRISINEALVQYLTLK